MIATVLLLAATLQSLNMGGLWRVSGEGIGGVARLPGTLADAGIGDCQNFDKWNAVASKQSRFALSLQYQFVGKATWSCEVEVPAELAKQPLELFLERVLWESTLKVDGRVVGSRDSLGTPHVYPFAPGELAPGRHLFELTIDNGCHYDYSGWAHAWGPTTQTCWNGVIGEFSLRVRSPLRAARVFARWPANGGLDVEVSSGAEVADVTVEGLENVRWKRQGDRIRITFDGEPTYWCERTPRLYTLKLSDGRGFCHETRFGFRTFERRGTRLYLNGQPFWMRGDVDNCQFPQTGYPAMTESEWRRQIRVQQLNGCNAARSHTWTPPEAAYRAADEMGFVWMVEVGYWADAWMQKSAVGRGNPALDGFIRDELRRIQDTYGGHPSVMSYSLGNELGSCDFVLMDQWMREAKAHDDRCLTMVSTARQIASSDDLMVTHFYPGVGKVRCYYHPHTDWDYEDAYSKTDLPTVAHEIGQWPVYPRWEDLDRYSGLLRPYDQEALRDLAASNGTLRLNRRWHVASLKTNRLMYKDEVEAFLRTPSCNGLQLLDVRDYTGQGEALVGWLDANFEAKPALAELPPFSSVLRPMPFLARFRKFVWTVGETFEAALQVRNLTDRTIPAGASWPWSFAGRNGWMKLEKDLAPCEIGTVGTVKVKLDASLQGTKQTLAFGENAWSVWVFPNEEKALVPAGVLVTDVLVDALDALGRGGRVVWTGGSFTTGKGKFKPVYWSSIHFPATDRTMSLGTWFDEDHPAFRTFPTENWMDYQWWSLADGATVHLLKDVPADFEPIAAPVSDFHFSEFLATMFELRVGAGRLFVCGYDLGADTPESRALRRSVFGYVSSATFHPKTSVDASWLKAALTPNPKVTHCARWDYRDEKRPNEQTFSLKLTDVTPMQGRIEFNFFGEVEMEATFEGRSCQVEFPADGGTRLSAQMNREDALDGALEFECHATKGGSIPRMMGIYLTEE